MITVVSGLPRSGTSMMMQMLERGGLPALTDEDRPPDPSNPRGYLEFAPVRRLRQDASWLDDAEGKAVKVIAQLLPHLDDAHTYRVVFMERYLDEVLRSQAKMLERLGRPASNAAVLRRVFGEHVERARSWLEAAPHTEALYVPYREVVHQPREQARRVQTFLGDAGLDLDADAMAAAVDSSLYRQRES